MPRQVWYLVIGMFLNTVGSSFLWPLNAIYIHHHLGKTLTIAGFVLMLNSLAAVVGNLLGGYLFDKIGGFKTIVIGVTLNIGALSLLMFWHDWWPYVILLTVIGFSGGVVFPAMYALIGAAWPEGGRKAFNTLFLSNNVGVAIGPALAGFIADMNFEYVFKANFFTYLIFFLLVVTTYKRFDTKSMAPKNVLAERGGKESKAGLYALLTLCLALVLCWMSYSQWSATISSYTQGLGMSLSQYSVIWTINGLLVVGFQPVIRPLVRRWEKKLKHQLALGLVLMSFSFCIVAVAEEFTMFAAAMVILTLGEVFFTPIIPTIANQLAPKGRQGFYQGIVNSATTIGRMIGPLFGGMMVDIFDMQTLMWSVVVLLLVAIIPACAWHTNNKENSEN
ncbi:MFS transporter [Metasolibacillus sp.]|uniref:MDR family MFS transporter n=1 Tax=Metasolibacillus sp. TaxID=2703680 RepID=UPI0025EA7CFD|nr:MFS transporter [Metasolibacillus sp.]MCT6925052.1 MFS transporter [Metasolibacillus sp.]MCT6941255.1 MFS transporter [Metasolibacillus sp.]